MFTVAKVECKPVIETDELRARLEAVGSRGDRPRVSGQLDSVHSRKERSSRRATCCSRLTRGRSAEVDRLKAELERAKAQLARTQSDLPRAERLHQ